MKQNVYPKENGTIRNEKRHKPQDARRHKIQNTETLNSLDFKLEQRTSPFPPKQPLCQQTQVQRHTASAACPVPLHCACEIARHRELVLAHKLPPRVLHNVPASAASTASTSAACCIRPRRQRSRRCPRRRRAVERAAAGAGTVGAAVGHQRIRRRVQHGHAHRVAYAVASRPLGRRRRRRRQMPSR